MLIAYSKGEVIIHYTSVFSLNWMLLWMTALNVLSSLFRVI